MPVQGASEEAVNAAREAFRLHQATLKRGASIKSINYGFYLD